MPSIRCARCGYENHPHQRFCGMCGNGLASTAPTRVITEPPPPAPQDTFEEKPVMVSGGPSFLGLGEASGNADYLLEENHRGKVRGPVFVLALMLAISCAVWLVWQQKPGWLSTQFAQVKTAAATILGSKPETVAAPPAAESESPAPTPSAPPAQPETAAAPPQTTNAASTPPEDATANDATAEEKPAAPPTQAAAVEKVPNQEPTGGVAEVEQGERYLYGHGVRQDCRRAQSSLMAAADLSDAKAQGILGTMYATGHCVPRDLPTAYHWFLQAKKEDPRNVRYEQDLRLVWRQMTARQQQEAGRMQP